MTHRSVIWDEQIAVARLFQSQISKCLARVVGPQSYARLLREMNDGLYGLHLMSEHFLDELNLQYLKMTRDKREKQLAKIARRIANFYADDEHAAIARVVREAAAKHGCNEDEIELAGHEYPEEIEW